VLLNITPLLYTRPSIIEYLTLILDDCTDRKMADYSEYSIPTEEWIALEKTLPPPATDLDVHAMKEMFNRAREERAANAMVNEGRLGCNAKCIY
jgi:hypothetical protein